MKGRYCRELKKFNSNQQEFDETIIKKIFEKWSREMSWWLRTLAVLPEDPGSIPSTHTTAHKHL